MQGQGDNRVVISLDGRWQFRHGNGTLRDATVPAPWQAQFRDLRHTSGQATYAKRFARPAGSAGKQVVLRFGAVSYLATVRLNGVEVARHEGGYLPFDCTLPPDLLADTNLIEVDCLLPDAEPNAAGIDFAEIPHGKQSWYGPIGGIWQSVTLELRDPAHLVHCAVVADLDSGRVDVGLTLSPGAVGRGAVVSVVAPDGAIVARQAVTVQATDTRCTLTVADVRPWSPDAPHLYRLRVELDHDSTDHVFGFRSIRIDKGRILLNGQPFYMRAALDQDYYPEGICTPPSLEFLEDQLRKAKELGLNMLRCHIKVPDPRYYEVADRLGMLIWTEIPNVGHFTAASARRMIDTMAGILHRDGNHPCIVIWTLINEDWGTRLSEDATHRDWLRQTFDWLKAKDPTRLVCDNSPCSGNFHVKSDLDDFHFYRSVPERRAEWDQWCAEFAARPAFGYSPYGDAERSGEEPLIVSEMGVWGLPQPSQVTLNGAEPWWMETGQAWGDGAAYPHGIQARYDGLRLNTVFGRFENFIDQAQWYQFANLKYEIEVMRSWPQIMGYVITEFTDVHWESNGLLDMNRNPRVFHARFGAINADVVIVPDVARYSGWAGQDFAFGLGVATGGRVLGDAVLHWQAGDGLGGQVAVPATGAVSLAALGDVHFALPEADHNHMLTVTLRLTEAGHEVARNQIDIAVYTRPKAARGVTLGSADVRLAGYATDLGYAVVPVEQADVVLANGLDAGDIARMQRGARYLVLADGSQKTHGNLRLDLGAREQPFMPIVDEMPGMPMNPEQQLPNMRLIARHGTMWRGDWIAGFSWLRRDGPFAAIPGGPLFDLSFDRVVPHHVLAGFKAWEFGGPVQAGIVVGWVHKPAAFAAERRVGRGAVVAATFRLMTEPPGADPVASSLFDALLAWTADRPTDSVFPSPDKKP